MPKSLPGGIRLAAAVVLLSFAPLLAFAAGLGRLTVLSALGQPLDAEIEIVSLLPGEEEGLTARLAPADAFRQAGIELSPVLLGARFSIERRAGRPYVRMRTAQPVNEPFLDVLVELQWATGRLVREYTFLLDPPGYRVPAAVAAAPAAAPVAKPEPAPAAPAPKVEARPIAPAAAPAPKAALKHEVKKGETLGAIARRNLPEGVTLNQMLIALFRANPDAFLQGNINLVRAGRILDVPARDAAAAVDVAEAERLVQSHAARFADYRRALGAAVAAAPAAPQMADREAVGRIGPKAQAPAPAATRDELRLSRVDPAKAEAPSTRAAIEDDRIARERALREAQSRIAELERNVAELQKLLELKSQQLAALEKKAAAVRAEPAPKPATEAARAPEAAKPAAAAAKAPEAVAKAEPPKAPEPAKPVAEALKAPEPVKPAAETAKAPEPAKAEDAGKAAAKPPAEAKAAKPKPAPAKAPEPGVVDQVLDFFTDPVSAGGLAAVLVLLAAYAFLQVRRRRAAQRAGFRDSVLGAASGAATVPPVSGAEAQQPLAAAAAGAAGAAVAAMAAGAGAQPATTAEAEELDPIAEADVYMAYGRYAQAEEILREALAKDPERLAVHAKLLEVYASQKNAQAFEQTALKVKSLTGASGTEWEKAVALGHSVDPSNPLYGTAAEVAATPALSVAAPSLDFDLGAGAPEVAAEASSADATAPLDFELDTAAAGADAVRPDAGVTLDFDLGVGAEKTGVVPADTLVLDGEGTTAVAGGVDFELDTPLAGEPAAAPGERAQPAESDQTLAMEFDLDLDLGETKAETGTAAAAPQADLGAVALDLPEASAPAGEAEAKWRSMSEKLELSRAYLDIGQKEEARELLDEVAREGDAAQQARAREMLAGLD